MKNLEGETPLDLAKLRGHDEVVCYDVVLGVIPCICVS